MEFSICEEFKIQEKKHWCSQLYTDIANKADKSVISSKIFKPERQYVRQNIVEKRNGKRSNFNKQEILAKRSNNLAAEELDINYSSAKTILHLYRQKSRKKGGLNLLQRCGTRSAMEHSQNAMPLEIIISHGGRAFCTISTEPRSLIFIPPILRSNDNNTTEKILENEDFMNYQQQSIYPHTELGITHLSALFELSTDNYLDIARSSEEIHIKAEQITKSYQTIDQSIDI